VKTCDWNVMYSFVDGVEENLWGWEKGMRIRKLISCRMGLKSSPNITLYCRTPRTYHLLLIAGMRVTPHPQSTSGL